jgi:hypothetical protein
VCEAFRLVKKAEVERFGEKSYFYRKPHWLPPAEFDDGPDLSENSEVRAHSFEEPEAEEMDVDIDETGARRRAEFSAPSAVLKKFDQLNGVIADAFFHVKIRLAEWIYGTSVSQLSQRYPIHNCE